MVYEIKEDYDTFVALAGVCESMLENDLGREIAALAKVVFKIFIDGKLIAESRARGSGSLLISSSEGQVVKSNPGIRTWGSADILSLCSQPA